MSVRSSGYSNAAYCSMYDQDEEESFWTVEDRETPLGASASGSFRYHESPASTPRKTHRPRQRSFSAPRNSTANVLAPMIAQARVASQGTGVGAAGIRRSKSAVFTGDRRMSTSYGTGAELGNRGTPARRTLCPQSYQRVPAPAFNYRVTPQPQEPPMSSWEPLLPQNRNLAVIPPNTRPRPEPLPPSPTKGSWAALPSASTPTNTLFLSGLFLIFASTINCLLCFYLLSKKGRQYYIDLAVMSGFAMLVLGYAAVRTGRWDWVFNRNYLAGYMVLSMLDVLLCGVLGLLASDWRPPSMPEIVEVASGAVSQLSCCCWCYCYNVSVFAGYMVLSMLDVLLCGVLGLLASDWRPPSMPEIVEVASGAVSQLSCCCWCYCYNVSVFAGYMVLSMLDVLLCGVLGLLASDWRPPSMPEIVEVASGAVCGLSALMLLLALLLCASSCCKHPPPDNRVSHSVPSLIV